MASLLKLMFAPAIIAVIGLIGLNAHSVTPSPLTLALVLVVLLGTGLAFVAYEDNAESRGSELQRRPKF